MLADLRHSGEPVGRKKGWGYFDAVVAAAAGAVVVATGAGCTSVAGVEWSPTFPAGASGTVTLIGMKRDLPYLSTP